jgi:integrase/recombinase XerD
MGVKYYNIRTVMLHCEDSQKEGDRPMENAITQAPGPGLVPAGTTDAQLVGMWIERENRSPHTVAQYSRVARQFFETVGKPLSMVNYADLAAWAKSIEGTPATKRTKVSAIKSLFGFAARLGYLRLDPAAPLQSPKVADRKHRKTLSEEEVIALVRAAGNARDAALLRTLYSSGSRVSELIGLTWEDVLPTTDGRAELQIFGKGGKSRRAGISPATYSALLAIRGEARPADPVFRSNRGGKMDRTVIHRMIQRVAKGAGIDHVSAHWLRHSHATHALRRGANPADLQEQLGHSSLAVTTGYAHRERSTADVLPL